MATVMEKVQDAIGESLRLSFDKRRKILPADSLSDGPFRIEPEERLPVLMAIEDDFDFKFEDDFVPSQVIDILLIIEEKTNLKANGILLRKRK